MTKASAKKSSKTSGRTSSAKPGRRPSKSGKLTWDLESIFPGGSSSKQFEAFRRSIARDLARAKATLARLPRRTDAKSLRQWAAFIVSFESLGERLGHADSFAYCLIAQNVEDTKAMTIYEELSSMAAEWETTKTGIEEFAMGVKDAV